MGNRLGGGRGLGNDVIIGRGGNDQIYAGYGNDTLIPGPGNDFADGDFGTDTISFKYSDSAVSVDLSSGTATGQGSDNIYGENVIGSAYDDAITGSNVWNILWDARRRHPEWARSQRHTPRPVRR